MRKSSLTQDEILEAEKAKENRKQKRAGGLGLAKARDAGSHELSNGVTIKWHVPRPVFPDDGIYVYPAEVPDGKFVLTLDGKNELFDGEEFRKWLRWV